MVKHYVNSSRVTDGREEYQGLYPEDRFSKALTNTLPTQIERLTNLEWLTLGA